MYGLVRISPATIWYNEQGKLGFDGAGNGHPFAGSFRGGGAQRDARPHLVARKTPHLRPRSFGHGLSPGNLRN